jgi:hypothetical protein
VLRYLAKGPCAGVDAGVTFSRLVVDAGLHGMRVGSRWWDGKFKAVLVVAGVADPGVCGPGSAHVASDPGLSEAGYIEPAGTAARRPGVMGRCFPGSGL